jgi:hypothetical protein
VHLNVLVGSGVPRPASSEFLEALDRVEVTHSDAERSGFQVVLRVGKPARQLFDPPLLADRRLAPGSRLVLTALLGARPHVLMDGFIGQQAFAPGKAAGESTLTLTGQDVASELDRNERVVTHPAQSEAAIALKILLSYSRLGLIPVVVPPRLFAVPSPGEIVPVQKATDLKYLQELAQRLDYVFHVRPGPLPLTNTAYFGPRVRVGVPQAPLSVDLGPDTNVLSLDFQNAADEAAVVEGTVQDPLTNLPLPLRALGSLRAPLAVASALGSAVVRRRVYRSEGASTVVQALSEAQAQAEAMSDVVTANGELDTGRYGALLDVGRLVSVRGVGRAYGGLYYVSRVTHALGKNSYRQSFTLKREGTGSTLASLPLGGAG